MVSYSLAGATPGIDWILRMHIPSIPSYKMYAVRVKSALICSFCSHQ